MNKNKRHLDKNYFDLSEGLWHKGVAHLYSGLSVILSIISIVLLMTTPKVASLSVALVNITIIPVVVTGVLSTLTLIQKNEKMYRVYTVLTIGYSIVVVAILTGVSNVLNHEAVQKFFEYSTIIQTTHKNVLPGIVLIIMIVVGLLLIGIITNIISVVLVVKNVKGTPRRIQPTIITAEIEQPIIEENEN